MKIFVYGNAQPLNTRHTHFAHGEMRAIPKHDVAAVFGSQYTTVVWGCMIDLSMTELSAWNALEAPEFHSRRIRLHNGETAWAFEYTGSDFPTYPPIEDGKFTPTPESIKASESDDQDVGEMFPDGFKG